MPLVGRSSGRSGHGAEPLKGDSVAIDPKATSVAPICYIAQRPIQIV
jgi:hypothetical protein